MANKTFSRKRKPAGLTTSYELKDHMVATNQYNEVLNPHPQYLLRSELASMGGDGGSISVHVADPGAHANYYVQLANVTDQYNLNSSLKVTSAKAVYDFYQIYLAHNHDKTYSKLGHTHDYIPTSVITHDISVSDSSMIIAADAVSAFYDEYVQHDHDDVYILQTVLTDNYKSGTNSEIVVASAIAEFYNEYAVHHHDDKYSKLGHTHDDILTSDALTQHATDPGAHPGLFVHVDHVVHDVTDVPATIDNEHVVGYGYFKKLHLVVDSCQYAAYATNKVLTSDTVFLADKIYYTHDAETDTFTTAEVTVGEAISGEYYEDYSYIIGPAGNNPLAPIFAPIIHSHTYADVGAAPTVHVHDDRYSLLDHDHDERYSLIHSHPYLSDTALEIVGIYPSLAIEQTTVTENQDYDPDDVSSEQYTYEYVTLNDMLTQGQYLIKDVPTDAPYRKVLLTESNKAAFYNQSVLIEQWDNAKSSYTYTAVTLTASNAGNYLHMYCKVPCTVGVLEVLAGELSDDEEGEEINVERGYYQTFTDASGAVLKRAGLNYYEMGYALTTDATFQDGITYYIVNTDGVYVAATVTVGNEIPEGTYYVESGDVERVRWSDWQEVGTNDIYAPSMGNRLFYSYPISCSCCYSKTSGVNYVDIPIPASISPLVNKLAAELDVQLECNTSIGTYGYAKGDVVVNPIVSNKANNESSFLGHAQVAIMSTSSSNKFIRLYLPLVWYVKVADAVEESVTLTSSNIYNYYRRSFTYTSNGSAVTVTIDASNAASLVGLSGTVAAITYGSKTIPVATQAECGEWNIRVRMKY